MRKAVILFLLVITTVTTHAQFSIGAKGGITVSIFSNVENVESDCGYKAGLSAQYMFSRWGIESGIYLTQVGIADSKGFLPGVKTTDVPVSMEVAPRYVEIPVSVVYKLPVTGNISLTVNGGGYVAYGYSGGGLISLNDGTGSVGVTVFKDNINSGDNVLKPFTIPGASRFDYGLTAGAGIEFLGVNITANYDYGLGNVYDQYPIYPEKKDVKNRVFWVGLGYSFKL